MEEINEKVQKSHENSRKVSVKYDNLGGVSCEETLCEIIYNSNVPDVIKVSIRLKITSNGVTKLIQSLFLGYV